MTMPSKIIPIVAGASLYFAAAASVEAVAGSQDRFQLFAGCRPMGLVVENLPKGAAEIGLTRATIETAVRSRLRAARLYSDGASPWLYVQVNLAGQAYNISIQYNKWVRDTVSGEGGTAVTWDIGSTGTHGRSSGYILSFVSQHMDKFIDEYLRVNASACKR